MPKPPASDVLLIAEAGVAEHRRGKPVTQTLATAVTWNGM
jgi:hypothetical protein